MSHSDSSPTNRKCLPPRRSRKISTAFRRLLRKRDSDEHDHDHDHHEHDTLPHPQPNRNAPIICLQHTLITRTATNKKKKIHLTCVDKTMTDMIRARPDIRVPDVENGGDANDVADASFFIFFDRSYKIPHGFSNRGQTEFLERAEDFILRGSNIVRSQTTVPPEIKILLACDSPGKSVLYTVFIAFAMHAFQWELATAVKELIKATKNGIREDLEEREEYLSDDLLEMLRRLKEEKAGLGRSVNIQTLLLALKEDEEKDDDDEKTSKERSRRGSDLFEAPALLRQLIKAEEDNIRPLIPGNTTRIDGYGLSSPSTRDERKWWGELVKRVEADKRDWPSDKREGEE